MTTTAVAEHIGGTEHWSDAPGAPAASVAVPARSSNRGNRAVFLSLMVTVQVVWLAALVYAAWLLV